MIYAIKQHHKRFIAQTRSKGLTTEGWRPFIWSDKVIDAEKFDSIEAAEEFITLHNLQEAEVISLVPDIPNGFDGGAIALRAA